MLQLTSKTAAHTRCSKRGIDTTNRYGNALVQIDPAAERRLRLKIDFMIVPTVSLLYLFCYIDRANIGNAKIVSLSSNHVHPPRKL